MMRQSRRQLLLHGAGATVAGVLSPGILSSAAEATEFPDNAMVRFARGEIAGAARQPQRPAPEVLFVLQPDLGPQAYRIEQSGKVLKVVAGDAAGAMYGGLDIAEALRLGRSAMQRVAKAGTKRPYVLERGIKFNIPLDLRTPSYADGSTAARANIPEVWSREFWSSFVDELAKHRYNAISLWSLHPFPSLVKVPEYPDIALDDVWRSKEPLGPSPFPLDGKNAVPKRYLDNHEVVKKISIDEKIAFWRDVMQMAADRGIDTYIFTWNVFTYGTFGKYGIDDDMANPATVAYMRASVRELVSTYPLLKGIGITAGENMKVVPGVSKEGWLWATYGEGVRDALKAQPTRRVRLIHRFWQTSGDEIRAQWSQYPGWPQDFAFSFKYSWAHMYSDPKPRFVDTVMPLLDELKMKTALEVRNDDVYSMRWGDPGFVRTYVRNMPPAERLLGFYMGPDGYTWGRDFLDRATDGQDLGPARPLVIQKQWYSFMLWGRLSYDPTLPDRLFSETMGEHFPGIDARRLVEATALASRIIPQTTRFYWQDTDLGWLPEASIRYISRLHTVGDFIAGKTMPASQILNIRQWRHRKLNRLRMEATTPLQVADHLASLAGSVLSLCGSLRSRMQASRSKELDQAIGDNEAMAYLGTYYAEKIRGACDLALFDATLSERDRASAVMHLHNAVNAWKRYAAIRDAQYVPAYYSRIGWISITELTASVEKDVEIARAWRPGSVKFDPNDPKEQAIGDSLRIV